MDSRRVNTQIEEGPKFNITPKNVNSNLDCSEIFRGNYDESNIGSSDEESEKEEFLLDQLNNAIHIWIGTFEAEIGKIAQTKSFNDGSLLFKIANLICGTNDEPIEDSDIMKFR